VEQYHKKEKKGEDDDNKDYDEDADYGYKYLRDIIEKRFIDFEDLSERDYITILLDLLLYKNEPLVRNAIEILSLHFSQKTILVNRLKEI